MAIITISRGTYSGGKAVAERLAERFRCPCLSREIVITRAASIFHLDEKQLNDAMEEAPGILRGEIPVSASNVNFVRNALLREIQGLSFIYHGLAGDLLLQGVQKVLRVRIIASRDYRIQAAMQDHSITRKEAATLVDSLDKKRDKWALVVLGKIWSDPSLYDVALNLDTIGIESAVDTVTEMARLREFSADSGTKQSLDDLLISSNIWAALTSNRATSKVQVAISSHNGEISLYGDVNSQKISQEITELASKVEGVSKVTNNLRIGIQWLW